MSHTYKNTIQAVTKRFDICVVTLYCGCLLTMFCLLWSAQNSQASTIFELEAGQNVAFESLLEVRDLTSNTSLFRQENAPFVLVRTINNKDKNLVLLFVHPLWQMLTASYFILFNFLFALAVVLTRVSFMKSLEVKLASIRKLENWAALTRIHGKLQPIEQQDDVSETIQSIIEQLHQVRSYQNKSEQLIRERVLLDSETGIGNREFFTNRLEALLREEECRGAILLICFNEFDVMQALYGQQHALSFIEDGICLCRKRLAKQSNYFIARRSESELAILIPGIYVAETEKLASKLLTSLTNLVVPIGINQDEFVHIGISMFQSGHQAYKLMSEADMALRNAQLQGPNQWFMYDKDEIATENAKGSLRWRTMLTRAIERNSFVIFFQPVIASDTNDILHHEVLTKVRDSQGKLISARVFLPMAKKCGLAPQVDMLVFEQVCRLLSYEGKKHDVCSLNIAIDSLLNEDFLQTVFIKLAQMPNIAQQLIIEVSEYHLVRHLNQLREVLAFLSELNIAILADKVGQYVVNNDYLHTCPINTIKLHKSMVYQIENKIENQVYIQSLATSCSQTNIAIYALGVESQQEWKTLKQLGVKGGQGHFFTEPVAQVAQAIELP